MRRLIALITVGALAMAACGDPDAGDFGGDDIVEPLRETPGPATVEDVSFTFLESDPVQVRATITGTLPTPCHLLDVARNGDDITIRSLYDPSETCAQVLASFETIVDLGARAEGRYELTVNGQPHPFTVDEPQKDAGVVSGPAFVDDVSFVFLESYPVQVRATISGNVPTPCHTATAEIGERDGDLIPVEVRSTTPADAVCIQVLEPFEITVDVGSFETGAYVLVIGGTEYPFTI